MKHLKKLEKIFKEYYSWDSRRVNFLSNMISSIIRSRSVNMQKVAENIEGEAKVSSNYRRIQRFFKEQKIDYEITAKLLSTLLPSKDWILTLDRTNWQVGKSNINLLVLAVAYKGMAIPLLWKFLTKESDIGKKGNSNFNERKELIERFIKIFGVEKIKALTADREFVSQEWFNWLKEERVPFVIRVKGNSIVEDLGVKNINELFEYTSEDEFYSFGKNILFGIELNLGGIKSSKSNEALILVSEQKLDEESLLTYRRRWEIETMFGALKSKGFNFEESKISEKEKVEKLMALLSISFIFSIILGEYRDTKEPISYKKREL